MTRTGSSTMGQKARVSKKEIYHKFDQLDGSHPLKKVVPKGYVDYPARLRKGGQVLYFNFELAKEMGLINKSHEQEISPELEQKILDTFSIQIINEFDQMKNRKFPEEEMKSGTYMATRYLQLQHEDKKGRTSGDGRSVWNGQIRHRNKTWDISSGGTGATCLSPATSKYNKFFETGDPSISYGCGYAELDEGLATALMSKIFKLNGIATEETLAIIDYGNNISINVRAYQNLLRPSHFFMYLKQDDLEALTALTDYYIETQREKPHWKDCPKGKKKYDYFLDQINQSFAQLAADLEDEYIFCWLDWDGDNILMDGGIIDYGSVRQFGLFHHEYRYDDVERYSTNLTEQKSKAKYIVQTFIQMIEMIKSGAKTPIQDFTDHPCLVDFEAIFESRKNRNILLRMGLSPRKVKHLLNRESELVSEFRKVFSYFEKSKSSLGLMEIPDGITVDAVFSMRDLLREYPQILLIQDERLEDYEFMELMKSGLATEEDMKINSYRKQKINEFQELYQKIVLATSSIFQENQEDSLAGIVRRSNVINKSARVTGDSVTYIVDYLLKQKKRFCPDDYYQLLDNLALAQNLDPDNKLKKSLKFPNKDLQIMLDIIEEHREGL